MEDFKGKTSVDRRISAKSGAQFFVQQQLGRPKWQSSEESTLSCFRCIGLQEAKCGFTGFTGRVVELLQLLSLPQYPCLPALFCTTSGILQPPNRIVTSSCRVPQSLAMCQVVSLSRSLTVDSSLLLESRVNCTERQAAGLLRLHVRSQGSE